MKKLLVLLLGMCSIHAAYGAFPDEYPIYLQYLGFSKSAIRDLDPGEVIRHSVKSKLPGEVGFTVATLIHVPPYYFRDYYSTIESFKTLSEFRQAGKFKSTPELQDLQALQLSDGELEELFTCRPQTCAVQLSAAEIDSIPHDLDISSVEGKLQIAAAYRNILLQRIHAYQANGRAGLAPYADQFPQLAAYFPTTKQYLLEYPKQKNKLTPEFFYWIRGSWGRRPVTEIYHVFSQRVGEDFVLVRNLVYASRHFTSSIGIWHLINYGDNGSPATLLVGQERAMTDLEGNFFVNVNREFVAANVERRLISLLKQTVQATEIRYTGRLYVGFPYQISSSDQR